MKSVLKNAVVALLLVSVLVGCSLVRPGPTEDEKFLACVTSEVLPCIEKATDLARDLAYALKNSDLNEVIYLEERLKELMLEAEYALLACPRPEHALLASSRRDLLAAFDESQKASSKSILGWKHLDFDMIDEGIAHRERANELLKSATESLERYRNRP